MTHFDCVIEHGTVDDFKECVLAVVYLPPDPVAFTMRITSMQVYGTRRALNAFWSAEVDQDIQACYSRGAMRMLAKVLRAGN